MEENKVGFLTRSILAGAMIGIGGIIFLSLDNKYIGSFLFAFGLMTIIAKEYNLYTGKIYSLKFVKKDILSKLIILLGNFIGSFLVVGLSFRLLNIYDTTILWENKLSNGLLSCFVRSVLCGILMYLAVTLSKEKNNPIYTIMPIMIFILSGSEHCVANMFYLALSNNITFDHIVYLLINIIGNSFGSICWFKLENIKQKVTGGNYG